MNKPVYVWLALSRLKGQIQLTKQGNSFEKARINGPRYNSPRVPLSTAATILI